MSTLLWKMTVVIYLLLSVIGDGNDFLSPCVSIVKSGNGGSNVTQYEDISDDDFDIPCSQMPAANNRKLI